MTNQISFLMFLQAHPGLTMEEAIKQGFTEQTVWEAHFSGRSSKMGDGKHFLSAKGKKILIKEAKKK